MQFEYLKFFIRAILYLIVTSPEDIRAPHPTEIYLKLKLSQIFYIFFKGINHFFSMETDTEMRKPSSSGISILPGSKIIHGNTSLCEILNFIFSLKCLKLVMKWFRLVAVLRVLI